MLTQYIIEKNTPFGGYPRTVVQDGNPRYTTAKTFEEFQAMNPDDELILISEPEFEELYKGFEKSLCNKWLKISEADYLTAFECLPPLRWCGSSFFIQEADFGNLHAYFTRYEGEYYTSTQPITDKHSEITTRLILTLNSQVKA